MNRYAEDSYGTAPDPCLDRPDRDTHAPEWEHIANRALRTAKKTKRPRWLKETPNRTE